MLYCVHCPNSCLSITIYPPFNFFCLPHSHFFLINLNLMYNCVCSIMHSYVLRKVVVFLPLERVVLFLISIPLKSKCFIQVLLAVTTRVSLFVLREVNIFSIFITTFQNLYYFLSTQSF